MHQQSTNARTEAHCQIVDKVMRRGKVIGMQRTQASDNSAWREHRVHKVNMFLNMAR